MIYRLISRILKYFLSEYLKEINKRIDCEIKYRIEKQAIIMNRISVLDRKINIKTNK
jgi:hypothetical protein